MNKEDLDIDNFFRSELSDISNIREKNSWDAISEEIRKRRSETKSRSMAAGLLLFISIASVLSYFLPAKRHPENALHTITNKNDPGHHNKIKAVEESNVASAPKVMRNAPADPGYAAGARTVKPKNDPSSVSLLDRRTGTVPGNKSILEDPGSEKTASSPAKDSGSSASLLSKAEKAGGMHLLHKEVIEADKVGPGKRTLDIGITIGYQQGLTDHTTNATILSSFFKYDLNKAVSISLQPAFVYNSINNTVLQDKTPYYANAVTNVETITEISPEGETIYNHNISVGYDSVSAGYRTGAGYWQVELPFFAQYRIYKRFFLVAGVAVRYSSAIPIYEIKKSYYREQNATINNEGGNASESEVAQLTNTLLTGTEFSSAVSENYFKSGRSTFSAYYGIGLTCKVTKRLGLELLGNKSLSGFKRIPIEKIRSWHQQPYFRISVLYGL